MTLSAYDSADSRPDFDEWRDSIRIQIAAADNSPACREARSSGPEDAARTHLAIVDGSVGGAARIGKRGPDVFAGNGPADNLLHSQGGIL